MIIKSITIHAFGKFQDKTIDFDEGLNLIYGLNEQGKSTIHKFIEAMFYGFYKAYTKNRQYEEGYEAYMPWDHSGYSGTLTLEDNGHVIRLERQFTKGKDDLKIYDVDTGDDITETYDYNKVIRQADPGSRHFGHNKITYQNTVSMTQMESKTDQAMITEIKDNMSNLASSHQSTISVERVIEKIEKKENAIGSNRKRTSAYYKLTQKIKELKEELSEATLVHQDISLEKQREEALKEELAVLEDKVDTLNKDLTWIEAVKSAELLEKIKILEEEEETVTKRMAEHELYKAFDMTRADHLRQEKRELEAKEVLLKGQSAKALELETQINKLEASLEARPDTNLLDLQYKTLNKDVEEARLLEQKATTKENEIEQIQRQKDLLDPVEEPVKKYLVELIMLGLVVIGFALPMALTWQAGYWPGIMILLFSAAGTGARYLLYKRKEEDYHRYIGKCKTLDGQIEFCQRDQDSLEALLKDLLSKHNGASVYDLQTQRDQVLTNKSLAESKIKELEGKSVRIASMKEEGAMLKLNLQKTKDSCSQLKASLEENLGSNHLKSYDDIGKGTEHYLAYKECAEKLSHLKARMKDLLAGRRLEDLKTFAKEEVRDVTPDQEETIKETLKKLRQTQLELSSEVSASTTKQMTMGHNYRTPAEVEEIISDLESQQVQYDKDLAVAGLMKKTISDIAIEIQNNFAPVLNDAMSEVVKAVTDSRYSDIKVNPEMALTIYDSENHRTISAERLSAGTIDILYFGLRLGISDVLTQGKKLPLILDDPFVQYDDDRVAQVVNLLKEQERQVLLFTCHKREMTYLEDHRIAYKQVLLT